MEMEQLQMEMKLLKMETKLHQEPFCDAIIPPPQEFTDPAGQRMQKNAKECIEKTTQVSACAYLICVIFSPRSLILA